MPKALEKNIRAVEFTVGADSDGKPCGDFLRSRGVSRRLITKLKRAPMGITRNGGNIRTVDAVRTGDIISLLAEDSCASEPNADLKAETVYEDNDVVVFNKPAGMPVHQSHRHRDDTLANLFAALYPDTVFRAVNRLDKDTSGLCVIAKNAYAAGVLSGNVEKVYYAVTEGTPLPKELDDPLVKWYKDGAEYVIDAPIGRADGSVINREVRSDGKRAVTRYTIIKESAKHCLVRVALETGRTHQIRVHFSSAGHPLAGDDLYGGSREHCGRQALHCGEISFRRPSDGEQVKLNCPLCGDMMRILD